MLVSQSFQLPTNRPLSDAACRINQEVQLYWFFSGGHLQAIRKVLCEHFFLKKKKKKSRPPVWSALVLIAHDKIWKSWLLMIKSDSSYSPFVSVVPGMDYIAHVREKRKEKENRGVHWFSPCGPCLHGHTKQNLAYLVVFSQVLQIDHCAHANISRSP